jgi:hypothetical protein
MRILTFYLGAGTVFKSFLRITFNGMGTFFATDSKSAANLAFYSMMTHIEFLVKNFLTYISTFAYGYFKAKRGRNSSRNIFYNCVLEFYFAVLRIRIHRIHMFLGL